MRQPSRVGAAVAAWMGTLLAAVAAAVLGVAYVIALFLSVDWSGMSRRSESSALSGVFLIGGIGGVLALWLTRRFCAASARDTDRLGGPVCGAILALAVAVQTLWDADFGAYRWWALVVAPLLGAFAGTAVPVARASDFVVTATLASAAAGYVTYDINTRPATGYAARPRLELTMPAPRTLQLATVPNARQAVTMALYDDALRPRAHGPR